MRISLVGLVLLTSACAGAATGPVRSSEWSGTITTDGDVTTVRNESGSVWGADAVLVEEMSIGTLEGDEEYMLGSIAGIVADGERIWAIDRQVPTVRVYDDEGRFLRDLGRPGQGPGEYERPTSVALSDDGRVFVRDDGGRRILIYNRDGEHLATYPLAGGLQTGTPMVIADGVPYTTVIVETLENDPNRLWILGMRAHGPDGPVGEAIVPLDYEYERGMLVARVNGGTSMSDVPFWPSDSWTLTAGLDVVSGVSTDYRFEIRHPDGRRTVVEKDWTPIPVDPDEAEWQRRESIAQMRTMDPTWTWNGPDIPTTKPPFSGLLAASSGEIWVVRPGPGERIEPCNEDAETADEFVAEPCWRERQTIDVFGADGRFQGSLVMPSGLSLYPQPWIRDDRLVARVEDDLGTVYIKRYRRVLAEDVIS